MKTTDPTQNLIVALISAIREREGTPTKTKLLKFLYLADLASYRATGETVTSFDWIFFHYGPWTYEYDQILSEMPHLISRERVPLSQDEGEAEIFGTSEVVDLEEVLPSYEAVHELTLALDAFANRSLAEILDYVYFETEPMEGAIRDTELDFSKIEVGKRIRSYRPSQSAAAQFRIKEVRQQFRSMQADRKVIAPLAPNYDDDYFELMEQLDSED